MTLQKELPALVEIRRDNRKITNVKRTRLLKKYNIEKTEELDQLIEELKQKFSAKTQRLSRYRKSQISITKISCLGQTARNFIIVLGRHTPM